MNKVVLLCMFLCVGALNGMKLEQGSKDVCVSNLPEDVCNEIIKMALVSSNNLRDAIKSVKVAEVLCGVRYDNLKDFTRIVHILADKFNITTEQVAAKFDTSVAEEYRSKGYWLLRSIERSIHKTSKDDIVDMIINNIQKDADINFSFIGNLGDFNDEIFVRTSPLILAIVYSNLVIVETLLKHGAIITDEALSLAEKMITFTDVNIPLRQRKQLIDNDKKLDLERIARYIERVLKRRDTDYEIHNDDAVKIYNLLLETMNK